MRCHLSAALHAFHRLSSFSIAVLSALVSHSLKSASSQIYLSKFLFNRYDQALWTVEGATTGVTHVAKVARYPSERGADELFSNEGCVAHWSHPFEFELVAQSRVAQAQWPVLYLVARRPTPFASLNHPSQALKRGSVLHSLSIAAHLHSALTLPCVSPAKLSPCKRLGATPSKLCTAEWPPLAPHF